MTIWTTKKIKDLFLNDIEEVSLISPDTFEIEFFKKAGFFDILVIEYSEGVKNFINNYKNRGYDGLLIFCDFKRGNFFSQVTLNSIVIDVNRLGNDNCKELIKFLIYIHRKRLKSFDLYSPKDLKFEEPLKENKISIKHDIFEKLNVCFKEKFNIVMSIPILEEGRKVTARGTGYIKDLNETFFIVDKIKPQYFTYRIKLEDPLTIVFSDRSFFYEAKCKVRNKKDDIIFLDLPEFLEVERRKFVRVEPSFKNPVKIYVHLPGEDNEIIDCLELSITGASIISQRDLILNGVYTFGIKTPYSDRFIICEGIIRHKIEIDQKFRYGIEFQLTEKDVDLLADYIRKREVEILELLKEIQ